MTRVSFCVNCLSSVEAVGRREQYHPHIWLSNLPLIITALCGLIALPYTVSKGAGAISDLAEMVKSYRK